MKMQEEQNLQIYKELDLSAEELSDQNMASGASTISSGSCVSSFAGCFACSGTVGTISFGG